MLDIWQEIYSTIRRNKLRTFLTGFAVAWGIFMLIVLLGAGNGLINAFKQQSSELAMNSMSVGGGWTSKSFDGLEKGRHIRFNNEDLAITGSFKENVVTTGAIVTQNNVNLSFGNEYVNTSLKGVFPNHIEVERPKLTGGRFINRIDIDQQRKVAVIHNKTAEVLFKRGKSPIGSIIKAGGVMYQVVGTYKDQGNQSGSPAFIPFTTLQLIYNKGDKVERILFTVQNLPTEAANEDFEKNYRASIAAHQRFDKEDENAMWIWNRFTQFMKQEQGMGYLTIAIWVIGIFTLLSGVVGVSNIMLITVKERTREFGIRKALGARPASILWLIIVESVVITTLFGYIGMVAGIGATEYMNVVAGNATMDIGVAQQTMFLNPTVDISIAIQATLTLIIAGTLAGFFPARKAVSIRPIEALRAD